LLKTCHFQEVTIMQPLFAFLSPTTIVILLIIGVLIFGRRLPEVGRSVGKGLAEFRKGVKGIEDDIDVGIGGSAPTFQQQPQQPVPNQQIQAPSRVQATAPKFEDNLPTIPTPVRTDGK
jgi:sec-independent protein translocase protein TatA